MKKHKCILTTGSNFVSSQSNKEKFPKIMDSHSNSMRMFPLVLKLFFFFKVFGGQMSFFGGHWYPCFGFLVTSPLGFKARVGSALFAIFAEANVTYIPQDSPLVLHLPTSWQPVHSWSLPHMHVQRWDLAADSNV